MAEIFRGFMYDVENDGNGKVIKTPRAPGNTSIVNEKKSLEIHKSYLGDVVPETDIISVGEKSFKIEQKYINGAQIVDLSKESFNTELRRILEFGLTMQEQNNIFFDIFGLQGMINLFNYYFSGTILKSMSDILLPINSQYLSLKYKFPKNLLLDMNLDNKSSPFLAYNLLKDEGGKIHFIDTDYRPLDIKHPLNLTGNWITQKALKDLKDKEEK